MKICMNPKCHDYMHEYEVSLNICPRCGTELEQVATKPSRLSKPSRTKLRNALLMLLAVVVIVMVGYIVYFVITRPTGDSSGPTREIQTTTQAMTSASSEPSDYIVHVITLPPTYTSAQPLDTIP